ncbi:MAG: response regulator, partial [bacterium]|nr:response regulator [bacterium]
MSIVESHLERHLSIKLLVADDHEVVRIGLRTLFRDSTEIDVVTEATTGEEATRLAIETTPDVVLLDVRLN